MKTKAFHLFFSLTTVVVMALISFSAMSCEKDDDDPSQLVGLWERELTYNDGIITEGYWFDEDGWGDYDDGHGKTGFFYYTIESPGNIRFKITYTIWIGGWGSYKDEFVWPYTIKGNDLTLNGNTYKLKSRQMEVYNIP